MFPPIMVYSWSFTAATPSFRCQIPEDGLPGMTITNDILKRYIPSESQCREYQSRISVSECQRCFQIIDGTMGACQNFIFNRTYYQSTLVEEVDISNRI